MTAHHLPDPRDGAEYLVLDYETRVELREAETLTPRRPRWPLILAIVVVIVAVVAIGLLARGSAATMPSAEPGAMRQAAAREENGSHPIIRPESPRQGWSSSSVPSPLTGSETAGSATLPDTATVLRGTATWYCGRGSACTRGYGPLSMTAAIDPTTGIRKGERLRVTSGRRSIVVTVRDVCACAGRRLIDLTSGAFSQLAPLSRGVIPVTIERVSSRPLPVLPPTDTALHGESE